MSATLRSALVALALLGGCGRPTCDAPLVLAAAGLQHALDEIADQQAAHTGCRAVLVFGSTGTATAQLENGARADAFFAADPSFVDRLEGQGLISPDSRLVYARGRLALVGRPGSAPAALQALVEPGVRFVAVANPEHAPYGRAAIEALHAAGVHDAVSPRLVFGENVAQTLQLVDSGNADAGIVALALVASRPHVLLDEALHAPLIQVAAVPARATRPDAGRAFLAFTTGPEGRAILARYGFTTADDR